MELHDFAPTAGNVLKCGVCGQGIGANAHDPITTNGIRSLLGYPPYIEILPEKERQRILQEASKLISGDREETYGPPEVNFGVIADFWNALGFKVAAYNKDLRPVDAVDVALAMSLVKTARLSHDRGHRDSWVDGPGYLALGGEIALKWAEPNGPFVEAAMKSNKEIYEEELNDVDRRIDRETRFVSFSLVKEKRAKRLRCSECASDLTLPFTLTALRLHKDRIHPEKMGYNAPANLPVK